MRISTNTLYQAGITKINAIQADQAKLQQQISTGKRILTPSDDPVASARVLEVSFNEGVNKKFADTRQTAQTKLTTLESSLNSITSLLISAQSTLVGAGNATLSNADRGFIASDLNGALQSLLDLANTQDASGNYLYSGTKTDTKPFASASAS